MAWAYVVYGPDHLRVYRDKSTALKAHGSLYKRVRCGRGVQVWVERVKINPAGVMNPYAKGAKTIRVWDKPCKRMKGR